MIQGAAADILEFLAEQYGTSTAARAVWQWAGGAEAEVEFGEGARALWAELWRKADDEAATAATRMTLTREALFDQPGHPLILDHLAELSATDYPEHLEDVDLVLSMLERLRPFGFPVTWLRPVLEHLPKTWEAAFATLAPAFDEWLEPADRVRLEESCRVAAETVTITATLLELRETLRAVDKETESEQVRQCLDTLRGLKAQADAWLLAKPDPLADAIKDGLRRLVMRIEFRKKPTARSFVAGLTSLLVSANANPKETDDVAEPLDGLALGVKFALWGTNAADGFED